MAWAYCAKCDYPLSYPSAEEVVEGHIVCDRCGTHNDPRVSVGELLAKAISDIETLNDRIRDLEHKISCQKE